MATALERTRGSEPTVFAEAKSGNAVLIETLRRWGVRFFAGVNGGGVVHVAKHLEPYYELAHSADKASRMLTIGEYVEWPEDDRRTQDRRLSPPQGR